MFSGGTERDQWHYDVSIERRNWTLVGESGASKITFSPLSTSHPNVFLLKRSWHSVFSVDFANFLRAAFFRVSFFPANISVCHYWPITAYLFRATELVGRGGCMSEIISHVNKRRWKLFVTCSFTRNVGISWSSSYIT